MTDDLDSTFIKLPGIESKMMIIKLMNIDERISNNSVNFIRLKILIVNAIFGFGPARDNLILDTRFNITKWVYRNDN